MKRFTIKGEANAVSVLELLQEKDDGFSVRIVRKFEDWEDIREDFLSRSLFETCLRTGYLIERTA